MRLGTTKNVKRGRLPIAKIFHFQREVAGASTLLPEIRFSMCADDNDHNCTAYTVYSQDVGS